MSALLVSGHARQFGAISVYFGKVLRRYIHAMTSRPDGVRLKPELAGLPRQSHCLSRVDFGHCMPAHGESTILPR